MRVWGTEQEISQTGLVSDLETVWRQFGKSQWREMFRRMGGVSKKKKKKPTKSLPHSTITTKEYREMERGKKAEGIRQDRQDP